MGAVFVRQICLFHAISCAQDCMKPLIFASASFIRTDSLREMPLRNRQIMLPYPPALPADIR